MASGAAPAEAQAEFHEWRFREAEKGNTIAAEDIWPAYWEKARWKSCNEL